MLEQVKTWIKEHLVRHSKVKLRAADIPDDVNLVERGIIDSLTFVGLMIALQERYEVTLDLEERPIEDFIYLNALARQVAEKSGNASLAKL
jgi:acyl carrier protein